MARNKVQTTVYFDSEEQIARLEAMAEDILPDALKHPTGNVSAFLRYLTDGDEVEISKTMAANLLGISRPALYAMIEQGTLQEPVTLQRVQELIGGSS